MSHPGSRLAALALVLGLFTTPTMAWEMPREEKWMFSRLPEVVGLYQFLHSHPELSGCEVNTARRLAEELKRAGAVVTSGVGRNGVVGIIRNGKGPTVLVRADMDALPVTEATGVAFASTVMTDIGTGKKVGVMHACGHDVHMASLVGTAQWLADHKDRWSGTAVLIGQPAEEAAGGARWMLADGLYTRFPRPDYALALHVSHDIEAGKVGFHAGPAMAGTTAVTITVRGRGGHGALPHTTADPIVLASTLVLDLQSIVSRENNPLDPAVVTIGSIQGGSESNVIPESVQLKLTIRTFRDEVRDLILAGIRRRANALAIGHDAPAPIIEIGGGVPPLINDPELVEKVVPAMEGELGDANVTEIQPEMTAEDFGYFGQGSIPTFMFRIGTVPPERMARAESGSEPLPSLHSPRFCPDPAPTLRTGVRAMTTAVVALLPPAKS